MRAFHVRLERGELRRPERLDLVEPLSEAREGFGPQPIHAHARVGFVSEIFHQSAATQLALMTAEARRADRERLRQITRALRLTPQEIHDSAPRGIGQRQQRPIEDGR